MDRHTAYARRLEQASKRQKMLAALAVMGVAVGVAGTMMPDLGNLRADLPVQDAPAMAPGSYFRPAGAAHAVNAAPPVARETAVRKVYPYSIVPGGVRDAAELARVIRTDFVVATHYAGFDVANARAVTVTKVRAVYVSYRKGDQVYWTKKKLMLAEGETLLTDGTNEMRARCANRISDVPQFPVESHGPTEAELDTVLADATEGGSLMAVAAGMGDFDDGEGSGQRFQAASFPYAAGLDLPRDTSAPERRLAQATAAPGLASSPTSYGGRLGGATAGDSAGTGNTGTGNTGTGSTGTGDTATGNSGAGDTGSDTGSGTGGTGTGSPGAGSTTPGTGSTNPGTGNPGTGNPGAGTANPGNPGGGTGNDGGAGTPPAAPSTPSTPAPDAGPQVPDGPPTPPLTPGQPTAPGDVIVDPAQPAEVPEPGTLWLGAAALAALAWLRRKGPRSAR